MISWLADLDRKLLLAINHQELPNGVHEALVGATTANTNKDFFWILIPIIVAFFVYRFGKKGIPLVLLTALLGALADQFNYRIVKALTFRVRPFSAMSEVILRVPYGPQSSSFPSNHATTTMALAVWLSYLFPPAAPALFAISFIIGYSRVYVGVHYPSDVLSGWIIGALMGVLMILATRRFYLRTAVR